MKQKETAQLPQRFPLEPVSPDPEQGLTEAQAAERREKGWSNRPSEGILPGNGQIILRHTLTFFNFVFLVLAVLLAIVGSFKNMTFLIVAIINAANQE